MTHPLGRDAQLSQLAGWVDELVTGRGRAVLVEGEPGIGKSALLNVVAAEAADAGCQVFRGTGEELGQPFPLLPLLDAFAVRESSSDDRRAELARLLRLQFTAGLPQRGDPVTATTERLLGLIDDVCTAAPAVLVVDDLQWTDPATVTALHRLARSMAQRALLLVGALRPVPRREDLRALRRAVGKEALLRLGPLTEEAVAELVRRLAGAPTGANLTRLAAGAAGNPLYLTELVEALGRAGRLVVADGTAEVTAGPVPSSVSEAITDRLDFLPAPVRETLQAASLLGERFSVEALTTVLGRKVSDLVTVLADARAMGVLTESGMTLTFRHPLIRAALYDDLPTSVRAVWHRDTAHALYEAGSPVDQIARQLLPAAEKIEDWTLDWLVRSASVLTGQTPQVGVELLRRGVTQAPFGDIRAEILTCWLADALLRAGEWDEAAALAETAIDEITDPDLLGFLFQTLTCCPLRTRLTEETFASITRGLGDFNLSDRYRSRLQALYASIQSWKCHLEEAERLGQEALSVATETNDPWATCMSLNALAATRARHGDTAGGLVLFERGLAIAEKEPALADICLLLGTNRARGLGHLDRIDEAVVTTRRMLRLACDTGNVTRLLYAQGLLGEILFRAGHWDDVLAEIDPPGKLAAASSDHGAQAFAALVELHRGQPAAARRRIGTVPDPASPGEQVMDGSHALALALEREQAGSPEQALAILTRHLTDQGDALDEIEIWLACAVRLALAAGDGRTARTATARAEQLSGRGPVIRRQAVAQHCRGLLDGDPALLDDAAAHYADACCPLPQAQALEAAARILAAGGDTAAARRRFDQAYDLYTTLGAAWDLNQLRAAFRSYGIRRGNRPRRQRPRTGWESLTRTEVVVTERVAEGLSNREIAERLLLSRRTVEVHVSHILRKLQLRSRVEIALEATRRARGGQQEQPGQPFG